MTQPREAALEAALKRALKIAKDHCTGSTLDRLRSGLLDVIDAIRPALALATPPDPPSVSVPAGWRMVEIEPNLQQIDAMARALCPLARPWDRQPEGVQIVNLGLAKFCWEAALANSLPSPVLTAHMPSREEIVGIMFSCTECYDNQAEDAADAILALFNGKAK